ncbi:MAG: class II glutamine amidotransferase, partial [Candidatus Binatia bacterium]
FAHGGSLRQRLELSADAPFEPVGSTDTEMVFCELLSRIVKRGWRSLGDADPAELHDWLQELDTYGGMTCSLSDGHDLLAYANHDDDQLGLYLLHVMPPYTALAYGDEDLLVDLARRGIKSRKGVVIATGPLAPDGETPQGEWRKLPPGTMVIVRQGTVRARIESAAGPNDANGAMANDKAGRPIPMRSAEVRRLSVLHRTAYTYALPVERSSHLLRLFPVHDRMQSLMSFDLRISVDGQHRDYDDVFGNRVRRFVVDTPFQELVIEARSLVELRDVDPLRLRTLHQRSTIPLVWMPWQRHMLQPYLLPPELAESELEELTEYAMSFVERNDYDLVDTLLDMNASIFREYDYQQGTTTLATTPFEVYANRRGVCQDFTNLLICLARLLGVPARYVCGYLWTGPKHANQRQAEASHAWAQVYLPEMGWKGLDPTNGAVTQTDHVRVACGRNWVDASPTSGTIYVGGGMETLSVEVRVEEAPDPRGD